jgi:hypothetical protein
MSEEKKQYETRQHALLSCDGGGEVGKEEKAENEGSRF